MTIDETIANVLKLSDEATKAPWGRWFVVVPDQTNPNGEQVTLVHGAAPPHEARSNHDGALNKAGNDAELIASYRTLCPKLARALKLAENALLAIIETDRAMADSALCDNDTLRAVRHYSDDSLLVKDCVDCLLEIQKEFSE